MISFRVAAAAKSHQSCLTLCDPIDGSPPGFSIHGISQARVLELGVIVFSSFRVGWFDFLAVQGILKSLLQYHNLKASILWHSAFFMVQHSHTFMTTGKTIALTIRAIVGKVISLLFNTLSRFVIAFLPKNKCLLISWLQSSSAVILELKPKSVTVSTFSPFIFHEVIGPETISSVQFSSVAQSCPTL